MKKSIWVLCFMGFGAVLVLGIVVSVGGVGHYASAPGVAENLDLKDRIQTLYQPAETVVAIDRSFEHGVGILVRLTWEDLPWVDDAGREALADEIGRFAWKNYPSSKSRPLGRVLVLFQVVEGLGCQGPSEVYRKEIPPPEAPVRGKGRGRGPPG